MAITKVTRGLRVRKETRRIEGPGEEAFVSESFEVEVPNEEYGSVRHTVDRAALKQFHSDIDEVLK